LQLPTERLLIGVQVTPATPANPEGIVISILDPIGVVFMGVKVRVYSAAVPMLSLVAVTVMVVITADVVV
jgi:hypothetical protein